MPHAFRWLLIALTASGIGRGGASEELAAVRAALARTEQNERVGDRELLGRLVRLGPSAAPALFSLVTGETTEEFFASGDDPNAWLCAPDRVGELALDALAALPPASVIAHLRARVAAGSTPDLCIAELRVLGRLGKAQGLELVLELARGFEQELVLGSARTALVEALVAILRQDAQAFRVLEERARDLSLDEQRVVCEALTATAEPEAARLLNELLGRDTELDLAALAGLIELQARYPWRMHLDLLADLRARLVRPDSAQRAQCAQALGRLGDAASVPALITCLADEDPFVVRAALWSLRELSERKDLANSADWKAWYLAELRWWTTEGEQLCRDLEAAAPSALAPSLLVLLIHPLAHAPVADALAAALPTLAPEGQVLVCRMLARLGARNAVPALVDLLSEAQPVRAAAWESLRALTGVELPLEPRVWERYIFG